MSVLKQNVADEVANILISLECVQLSPHEPFVYASGLKGPIYCDNRKMLSHVKEREFVIERLMELIDSASAKYDKIAGLATAGIPYASMIAQTKKEPLIYIRSSTKKHGKGNQVEGAYSKGDKIILIEDLVNQAKSLEDAFNGATNAELKPTHCFSIVDYQMEKAKERIASMQIGFHSLTNFDSLVKVAIDKKIFDNQGADLLKKWKASPEKWQ